MTKQAAKTRVAKLRQAIEHHRYLYHVRDTQEISDAALDSLKNELEELERQYPDLITPDSPTQRVGGAALPEFSQVPHRSRMLSLQDAFSEDDLLQWEKRNQKIVSGAAAYLVELKIDGVAVSLTYRDGVFVQGATRGDGFVGEDVTQNLRTIDAIPLRLAKVVPGEIEVRGEVYLLKKDFDQMNEARAKAGLAQFANPRNIAAGSIRQLDSAIAAARPLRFYAWEITRGAALESRAQEYAMLQTLGFPVPPDASEVQGVKAVMALIKKIATRRLRYPFLVDGLVIKINDLSRSARLGVAGKAPRGSIAYKFAAEEATTIVEDIVVQVGRTGTLTPVAHLTPVAVAGTTVSRATLHNADEIARKDVRVGDTVIVRKAGDIIPEIVQSLPTLRPVKSKPFVMPTRCPMCQSPVARDLDGVAYRCTNRSCFSMQRERILHAVSRAAFDIEGLGDKIVEQLLQEGLIEDPADLWDLAAGDLLPLERFADTSAHKLIVQIQGRKQILFSRFIVALGIPHIGTITAVDLAREFQTLDRLLAATQEQLLAIEGIGETVAEAIGAFTAAKTTRALIKKYLQHGVQLLPEPSGGPLTGQTFVFTGSLGDLTRDEAKQLVQKLGGKIAATVSATVSYVVVGDDAGSKAAKARALKVPVISPAEFKQLVSPYT